MYIIFPNVLRPEPDLPLQPNMFPGVEEDPNYSDPITQETDSGLSPTVFLESSRITDIHIK